MDFAPYGNPREEALNIQSPDAETYVQGLFDLIIRDSPFCEKHLKDLHDQVSSYGGHSHVSLQDVMACVRTLKKEEIIQPFDRNHSPIVWINTAYVRKPKKKKALSKIEMKGEFPFISLGWVSTLRSRLFARD